MKEKLKLHWQLFWAFFKIGILTIGGGLAMLPMLQREVVEKYKWCSEEQLLDIYAIGQCTPGIIAVNTATYIGYLEAGVLGSITATAGMIAPSLIIIIAIAAFLNPYMSNKYVAYAFSGIRVVVCAMMFNTVILMAKKGIKDLIGGFIFLGALLLATFTPIPVAIIVVLAGVLGVVLGIINRRKEGKK